MITIFIFYYSNMTVTYGVHGDGRVVTYHQLEKQKDSISKEYEMERIKNQFSEISHVTKEEYNSRKNGESS